MELETTNRQTSEWRMADAVISRMVNTQHLAPCLIEPIPSSIVMGGIFHGFDGLQGAPLSLRMWGFYAGGLWMYHAMICPMEVIHGRRSSLHNVASGGILGYIGVQRGVLGVPFVNPYILYGSRFPPGVIGGAVYGLMGGVLATLGGKQL